jgi:hypothetical protein
METTNTETQSEESNNSKTFALTTANVAGPANETLLVHPEKMLSEKGIAELELKGLNAALDYSFDDFSSGFRDASYYETGYYSTSGYQSSNLGGRSEGSSKSTIKKEEMTEKEDVDTESLLATDIESDEIIAEEDEEFYFDDEELDDFLDFLFEDGFFDLFSDEEIFDLLDEFLDEYDDDFDEEDSEDYLDDIDFLEELAALLDLDEDELLFYSDEYDITLDEIEDIYYDYDSDAQLCANIAADYGGDFPDIADIRTDIFSC